ncbi:hypothetical protein J1N35_037418 [Gossypium stocksii]|uniref:Uncharacterized protein n=1 Tax=Gossypium stocksii TaxID=47602 RepID=A0A9D3ULZ3_9ROSI|nr:hypothetical protein J1N35_037418 [Gossypium stocksii]
MESKNKAQDGIASNNRKEKRNKQKNDEEPTQWERRLDIDMCYNTIMLKTMKPFMDTFMGVFTSTQTSTRGTVIRDPRYRPGVSYKKLFIKGKGNRVARLSVGL